MDRGEFLRAALAVPLAPRVLAGGKPVAYVTADLESHVVVIDLGTPRVVHGICTGPGPRSVESVHDWIAVVAHTEHGVMTLLDAATSRIRAELDAFEAPRYTAVHPRRTLAYVTDSAREEVVVVDAEHAKVLWRTRVPGPARHVAISSDGRNAVDGARNRGLARRRARRERPFASEARPHDLAAVPRPRCRFRTRRPRGVGDIRCGAADGDLSR